MRVKVSAKQIPLLATTLVCLGLYSAAAVVYNNFFSVGVFLNFFNDNAVLGIAAIGMTFVILAGGIDLSVGSIVGLTSMIIAVSLEKYRWSLATTIPIALGFGLCFGAFQGILIEWFALPPFLVTLAGMFLARGLGFLIRLESIPINHPIYSKAADFRISLSSGFDLPTVTLIFAGVVLTGLILSHWTPFGRNIYAVGGNEQSALLMGLPVRSTKIRTYAMSGLCSAVAGVVYTLYTFSGNPTAGTGLELEAIAAVVIGGTLLSGGVGYVAGTVIGVLILGIIQTGIMFQGNLSSWWTKIAIGLLLLFFILLQKIVQSKKIKSLLLQS